MDDEVQRERERARAALRDARVLLEEGGSDEGAINRLYYGASMPVVSVSELPRFPLGEDADGTFGPAVTFATMVAGSEGTRPNSANRSSLSL